MGSATTLSHEEARQVYDRMGSWLDTQSFYEDAPVRELVRNGRFESADAVYEFGCGTGRLAERLLREEMGSTATYRACDLSPKMVSLARARLAGFGPRVSVLVSEGDPPSSEPAGSCDRFVSTYVFDLLSESDIIAVLAEARRMLRPGGLLCLTSLARARGPLSRAVMGTWSFIHRRNPRLVGGCRSIELLPFVDAGPWKLQHHGYRAPLGVPSEILVAESVAAAG